MFGNIFWSIFCGCLKQKANIKKLLDNFDLLNKFTFLNFADYLNDWREILFVFVVDCRQNFIQFLVIHVLLSYLIIYFQHLTEKNHTHTDIYFKLCFNNLI